MSIVIFFDWIPLDVCEYIAKLFDYYDDIESLLLTIPKLSVVDDERNNRIIESYIKRETKYNFKCTKLIRRDDDFNFHSVNDQPSIDSNFVLCGVKRRKLEWTKFGLRHRDNGLPAVINEQYDGITGKIERDEYQYWKNGYKVINNN